MKRTQYKYLMIPVCLSILTFGGCSPEAPSREGFDKAAEVGQTVTTDSLMPAIRRLAQVRLSDTPVDCEGFEPGELFPACDLTRDASVKFVAESFQSLGYDADTVALMKEGQLTAYNVVAEWPGVTKPQEVVLLGSHLDAYYAGADDNGSAVAVMLETARAVRNFQFARTIRFISFDLEEYGSVGSTRYVEAGYANDIVAGIVMDLIGYASSEDGSQKQLPGIKLPDKGDFLLVAGNGNSMEMTQQMTALCNTYNLTKAFGLIVPGDGAYFFSSAFMRSDHGLLWFRGIPVLFITDTANFRNPNYHKLSDTPETLDSVFLAQNARAVAATIALMAEVQ